VWNELHLGRGIYRGNADEICDFLQFFQIFWAPNGQKWLVAHVDQSGTAMPLSPIRYCLRDAAANVLHASLSLRGMLQRGRERGDIARSCRAVAATPAGSLSPNSRLALASSPAYSPSLRAALAPA
jgi:hypothetical protein